MRFLAGLAMLLLCGCGTTMVHSSGSKSREDMEKIASLIVVGVIESHALELWPFFRVVIPPGTNPSGDYWRILRRDIRVEMVLRGAEARKIISVYEVFWTGATVGDWNFTQNGERDLFLLRKENGRYRLMADWWRTIFRIDSGPHRRLPLDESHAFWERIALMNYWVERNDDKVRIIFWHTDPGGVLSLYRSAKLLRGLTYHPSPGVRLPACRQLIIFGRSQDDCWDRLSEADKSRLSADDPVFCSPDKIAAQRQMAKERGSLYYWEKYDDIDQRRLLTTNSNRSLRAEFCRLWAREYPKDHDNGCPANAPLPATIVREQGDVPLIGPWPK